MANPAQARKKNRKYLENKESFKEKASMHIFQEARIADRRNMP
jgi:hypothetical protein